MNNLFKNFSWQKTKATLIKGLPKRTTELTKVSLGNPNSLNKYGVPLTTGRGLLAPLIRTLTRNKNMARNFTTNINRKPPNLARNRQGGTTLIGSKGMNNMTSAETSSPRNIAMTDMDSLQRQVREQAKAMGFEPEIREMFEQVEDTRRLLFKKMLELNVLEAIAMESDNTNIVALREELFTVAKMVHTDLIAELTSDKVVDNQLNIFEGGDQGSDVTVKEPINIYSIRNRIHVISTARKLYKGLKKLVKSE